MNAPPPDEKPANSADESSKPAEDNPAEPGNLAANIVVKNEEETIEVKPEPKSAPPKTESSEGEAKPKPQTLTAPAMGRMSALPATGLMPPSASGKLLDRKIAYRHWLESRSKEELIELILNLEGKEPALEVTEKMMKAQTAEAAAPPASYSVPSDLPYAKLPIVRKEASSEPTFVWQIVLVDIDQSQRPLGLIIDDTISVGRTTGDTIPDLDLSPFGASTKGVSRIHARLRPLANSLALIDEKSTNGTFCNKSKLQPGVEQYLNDGDVITFGKVNFLVKIVKSPATVDPKTVL